jgi:hypothetical protein
MSASAMSAIRSRWICEAHRVHEHAATAIIRTCTSAAD